jgi:DNA-binding NarL/FixJ family response regulator
VSLALLWRELSRGLCKITDGFFSATRCYLLTTTAPGPAQPLEGRRLHILEAVLAGVGQKNIAIELELAPSTIALNARLALDCLGIRCRPSRVNPLLMLAAQAELKAWRGVNGSLSFATDGDKQVRVISVPRPGRKLEQTLPRAEFAVVRSLIEGASYEDIARQRGTSTRTIANQVTAVFRRMKVSGRSELLLRLFADDLIV